MEGSRFSWVFFSFAPLWNFRGRTPISTTTSWKVEGHREGSELGSDGDVANSSDFRACTVASSRAGLEERKGEAGRARESQDIIARTEMAGDEQHDGEEPTMKIIHKSALNGIKDLLFPVLFLMVHGNDSNLFVAYIAMLIEGIQLAAFLIRKTTVPIYNLPDFDFDLSYDSMTVDGFTGLFVASTVAIWLMIVNLGYVAWGAHRKHHNAVWPIRTLRLFSSVLSTVMYITVLEVLVFAVVCKGSITDPTPSDLLVEISCNATLIVFIPLCCGLSAVYYDINPILKAPMNKAHGRVDLIQCALRTALIIIWAGSSDDDYILRYGATFAVPSAIVIATWAYFPHYALKLNQMRTALHGGAGTAGAIAFLWALIYNKTGIVGSNAVMITMLVAYLVSAVCTYIVTDARVTSNPSTQKGVIYRRIHTSVGRQMERLMNGTLGETEIVFDNWQHVEIAARMATETLDSRHKKVELAKVEQMHKIFKVSFFSAELPNFLVSLLCACATRSICELDPFPIHTHGRVGSGETEPLIAIIRLQLQTSTEEPSQQLQRISDLNPAVDVQFQAFYIDKKTHQNREADFLGSGVRLDVAGFAEFQKLEGYAKVNHYKALRLYQEMWTLLYQETNRIQEVKEIACVLYDSIETADSAYSKLVTKFPKSRVILRFYAQFCLDLLKDHAKAELLSNRADRLESRLETDSSQESFQMRSGIKGGSLLKSRKSASAAIIVEHKRQTALLDYCSGESIDSLKMRTSLITQRNQLDDLGEVDEPRRSRKKSSDAEHEAVSLFAAVASRPGSKIRGKRGSGSVMEHQNVEGDLAMPLETIKSALDDDRGEDELPNPGYRERPTKQDGGLPIDDEEALRVAMRYEEKSSLGTSNAEMKQAKAFDCDVPDNEGCMSSVLGGELCRLNESAYVNFEWLHIREYSTAIEFLRARQLQDAYQAGDRLKFRELQDSLQSQMFIYSDAIKNIYANRPTDDGGLSESYYTVPQIPVNVSYYPQVQYTITVNYSLQQLTEAFVTCGINIANLDFDSFGNVTTNNDFRFIVDNAPNTQAEAFDYSMAQKANSASIEMYSFAQSLQIFVACVLVILLARTGQRYKRQQDKTLEVFQNIPLRTLSDLVQQYEEESLEEIFGSELVSSSPLLLRKRSLTSRIDLRWQYGVFSILFMALCTCFLCFNISDIYSLGQYFAILDQFGDMRTFAIRSYYDIHDIHPQLDFQTWLSRDYLYEWANHDVQYMAMTYGHVLYGDNTRYPPSVSYDRYSPALQQMLQTPCLPLNESLCDQRIYDPSIAFTNNTVTLGIFMLTEFILDILLKTNAALTLGAFTPDVSDLAFIRTVLEPDYVDGYHRCELEVLAETQQFLSNSKLRNTIITIVEIVVCIVGFMFALTTMFTRLQDICNVDLIVRLPTSILREPAVAAVLKELAQGNLKHRQEGSPSYWPSIRLPWKTPREHQQKQHSSNWPLMRLPSKSSPTRTSADVKDTDLGEGAMSESQYIVHTRTKSAEIISPGESRRLSIVQFTSSGRSERLLTAGDRGFQTAKPVPILRKSVVDRPDLLPARAYIVNGLAGSAKTERRASEAKMEGLKGVIGVDGRPQGREWPTNKY
ncbi:hypothetical protein BDK51DRAFT_30004 [Blyttiomyces helicus]|uniref:TmcB/TmcC TPR repeats domain-containing protein n=1 Tax=Blyttiomyces helicus TaxID=388810 RepID=A0A4V1ISH1_9FUNG|nr:hypothetical protein BDK51DRAFT_30004 [Blyttiomyces helicus]|eukprot:RKO93537.1 hypothetical protein BDK51DRAFT_30004 [Blyttiomyces helicus]